MELRIKQLGLDQKCNAEVYSSTIDGSLHDWKG
jgi:hypothetical protein